MTGSSNSYHGNENTPALDSTTRAVCHTDNMLASTQEMDNPLNGTGSCQPLEGAQAGITETDTLNEEGSAEPPPDDTTPCDMIRCHVVYENGAADNAVGT